MIKPYRRYIRKRTFGYFYTKLNELTTQLSQIEDSLDLQQVQKHFLAVINSYLGFFKGCKSYQQRKQIIEKYVHPSFREYFSCNESYTKITRLHIMNQKSNNGSSK
ncbi:MAG: hypothetical protein LBD11_06400 [Candidatus Peribacteria bacterium]|nr:hypothetical protein [Candidatus Peribacteria bacterium]